MLSYSDNNTIFLISLIENMYKSNCLNKNKDTFITFLLHYNIFLFIFQISNTYVVFFSDCIFLVLNIILFTSFECNSIYLNAYSSAAISLKRCLLMTSSLPTHMSLSVYAGGSLGTKNSTSGKYILSRRKNFPP